MSDRQAMDGVLRRYMSDAPAHGSATDAVTNALREAILDGTLPPSTWLREDELARQLRVSRTPVREALRRLSDENLTEHVAHRGSVVSAMSLDDILAVYMVRETLEGLAARMTAARQPAGIVESLTSVYRKMIFATEARDGRALSEANREFHRLLREGSGNSYLERYLAQASQAIRRFRQSSHEESARAREALAEHKAIIEAIGAADPELAARRAAEHMRNAKEVRVQTVLSLGGPSSVGESRSDPRSSGAC